MNANIFSMEIFCNGSVFGVLFFDMRYTGWMIMTRFSRARGTTLLRQFVVGWDCQVTDDHHTEGRSAVAACGANAVRACPTLFLIVPGGSILGMAHSLKLCPVQGQFVESNYSRSVDLFVGDALPFCSQAPRLRGVFLATMHHLVSLFCR